MSWRRKSKGKAVKTSRGLKSARSHSKVLPCLGRPGLVYFYFYLFTISLSLTLTIYFFLFINIMAQVSACIYQVPHDLTPTII